MDAKDFRESPGVASLAAREAPAMQGFNRPILPSGGMNGQRRLTTNSLIGRHRPRYCRQPNRHTTDMQIRYFQFANLRNLFAPRKPRNPLLRIALGLLGLAILAVLIVAGVFIGAAMILVGLTWKLLAARKARAASAASGNVMDGEYRVVRKPALPSAH